LNFTYQRWSDDWAQLLWDQELTDAMREQLGTTIARWFGVEEVDVGRYALAIELADHVVSHETISDQLATYLTFSIEPLLGGRTIHFSDRLAPPTSPE
jgi:hypothetical protein